MTKTKSLVIILLILGLSLADAIFKVLALKHLPSDQTTDLNPILDLAIHKNPGIAFDIPLPLSLVIPLSLIIIGVFAWIVRQHWSDNRPQALSAIAVVFGALGNAVDRLINNFTTDYLILFQTSAINLSDVLILLGIVGSLWYSQNLPASPSANGKDS